MPITVRELESSTADDHIRSQLVTMLEAAKHSEQKRAPHLASLIELGSEALVEGLLSGEAGWLVAQSGEKLLGVVRMALHDHSEIILSGLYVASQARRKGVGSQLIRAVINAACYYPANKIVVMVAQQNPAVHFYQALGFTFVRRAKFPKYIVMEVQINCGG